MLYMSDENTNFTSHIPNLPLQVFTVVVAVDDIGLNNNDSWSWHASLFWSSVRVPTSLVNHGQIIELN